jgi:hypothetical protein
MTSLRQRIDRELRWVQPKGMRMEFELRDGDDVPMTLVFRSSFGSHATLRGDEGCWTLKRVGFFKTHVTVRSCDDEKQLATFQPNTWANGGSLEFPNGRRFLANSNFWATSYRFASETEDPLVAFHKIGGLIHLSSRVEILPAGAKATELPLLVGLGWYLIVLMQMDAGAIAAVAAAGA